MSGVVVVCDTGPLISLEKMDGGFSFLRKLYNKIYIPPSVFDEFSQGGDLAPYMGNFIEIHSVDDLPAFSGQHRLDIGEQEAIQLALALNQSLLIEERTGFEIAQRLGLKVSGIAGQIVKAHRLQKITAAEANMMISALLRTGRINKKVYKAVIDHIDSASPPLRSRISE